MAGYIGLGRIPNVEVRLHAVAIAGAVIVAAVSSRPWLGAGLFAIIIAHEIGHALLARRLGFQVIGIESNLLGGCRRYRGKLTARSQSVVAWGGVLGQLTQHVRFRHHPQLGAHA